MYNNEQEQNGKGFFSMTNTTQTNEQHTPTEPGKSNTGTNQQNTTTSDDEDTTEEDFEDDSETETSEEERTTTTTHRK